MAEPKRRPGRPPTGQTPTRSMRLGPVYDRAKALAEQHGETITHVIERKLKEYVMTALVTDNAHRYEPEGAEYAFTWVQEDPVIGLQPYIYVWAKGAVGDGEPVDKLGVWTWSEGAPTLLPDYFAFVERCDEWLENR